MVGSIAPPATSPTRKLAVAASYFTAYFLLGLMLTSIGPCMDDLKEQTGSSTAAISFLIVVISLGYIGGSILGGRLFGRLPGNRILATALAASAALTVTIPWLAELWMLIIVFVLVGVTLGVMDVGGNTLTVWLYGSAVAPYMNALHLCFGIGAFAGPLIMNGFASLTGSAVDTYWLYAGLMVPVTLWLAARPSPQTPASVVAEGATTAGFLRRHALLVILISAFFFMHMGAELSFAAYIASYADDLFYSESLARVVNSVFWGGLVAGRLMAIPLAVRLSAGAMLQIDLAGLAVSAGLLLFLPGSTIALWVGTIGLGVSMASMIPSSINYASERMPITGQITALFLVGGSIGSIVLPLIVGQLYGEGASARPEMMVYVTVGAVLGAIALFAIMAAYTSRRRAAEV